MKTVRLLFPAILMILPTIGHSQHDVHNHTLNIHNEIHTRAMEHHRTAVTQSAENHESALQVHDERLRLFRRYGDPENPFHDSGPGNRIFFRKRTGQTENTGKSSEGQEVMTGSDRKGRRKSG